VEAPKPAQANFVIATIIPITTNTTIAICIQIQLGDIAMDSVLRSRSTASSVRAHAARDGAAPQTAIDCDFDRAVRR
jgi:hypothetical protein